MKKIKIGLMLSFSLIVLAACGNVASSSGASGISKNNSSSGYQTTGQTSDSNYEGVIKSGKYLTSKSRGVALTQNENVLNLKSFESGLLDLSKSQFATNDYIFQEGQYLSKETVQNWLSRESGSNSEGLNPKDNGKTGETERNPMYVQQLEEQDFMTKKDNKMALAGISLGIGMNSVDYYQKEEYGAQYKTEISDATMKEKGKEAANKVVARLRKTKGVSDSVPIMVAMYKQASNDSLVGGSFYAYAVNKNGKTTIDSWKDVSITSYTFPTTSSATTPNTNDETTFTNFKTEVQSFFPNLAGVTAQVQYKNKAITGMHINITSQFYSETEIVSFTQYLATTAAKYLASGIPIDITVKGSDGTIQSFLAKSAKDSSYYTHVFTSY
ncbi:CamS family sex pheromone protein [Dellaglioa algida]|uniref:Lipoprotein, pheromone n=1 Tax=Dellaglioa algida DSM 15638 TaxID=1423719 RepID=A0A0R1HGP6_9LACO|nr:CamS family sex pheromone protein [Dellaglioa algida]KRK45558.1 lipoprotein, pheromone precursor [Dellaglioa algida DSM 15638]MDK1732010.1 CamS family sex pheromone protein [Dellaglioa algida]MDK1733536.1 CamS family sex pheromone protein [Dellaglioa algida]